MSAKRKQRIWELFEQLADLPREGQERELEALSGEDRELRSELLDLLAAFSTEERRKERGAPSEASGTEGQDPLIGQVLSGKYAVVGRIGRGSMGSVYLGQHLTLQMPIAIKVLHDTGVSPGTLARMVDEAATVASLRHEHIVPVHDVGSHAGRAFMVMDFIESVDLSTWLAHAKVQSSFGGDELAADLKAFVEARLGQPCTGSLWDRPYTEIVTLILRDLARAAEHAHERGYIHRDIAPKNVLLTRAGQVFLIDFGVATLSRARASQVTKETVAGTLEYVSPEQLVPGSEARMPTIDVYGLGATFYHLLSGRLPFEGEALEVFQKIRTDLPPELRSLRRDIHRDLEAICFGAMEKRARDRYPTARALADDLDAFLERRPVSRRTPTLLGRLGRWSQRRPAAALATGALVALGVVAPLTGYQVFDQVREVHAKEARAEFAELFATLPALCTLDSDARYEHAPLPAAVDAELGEVWERLIELQPELPFLRWYRANWLSQHGDIAAVTAEFEALRDLGYGSKILDELDRALTSDNLIERNQLVTWSELPPAETAFEWAITGSVAMRQREFGPAYEQLTRAIDLDPDNWMYFDLRSVAGLESASADLCIEDAVRVEGELGLQTARTLHVRAFLTRLDFPGRANDLWLACLEKGGEQHQVLHNFGELLLRFDKFDDAAAILARAVSAKPGSWRSHLLLSRCAELRGRHAEAEQILVNGLAQLPSGQPGEGFQPRTDLEEERIALYQAWTLQLQRSGSEEAAAKLAIAADLIKELDATEGPDLTGAKCQQRALEASVGLAAGSWSAEQALGQLRAQHRLFAAASAERGEAPSTSALISACLGFQLQRQGPEHYDEAEVLLLSALQDRALRDEVVVALSELRAVRSTESKPAEEQPLDPKL